MKNKEIKNLAKKIAQYEKALREDISSKEKAFYEQEIMRMCSKVQNMEEMLRLDEEIQKYL